MWIGGDNVTNSTAPILGNYEVEGVPSLTAYPSGRTGHVVMYDPLGTSAFVWSGYAWANDSSQNYVGDLWLYKYREEPPGPPTLPPPVMPPQSPPQAPPQAAAPTATTSSPQESTSPSNSAPTSVVSSPVAAAPKTNSTGSPSSKTPVSSAPSSAYASSAFLILLVSALINLLKYTALLGFVS
jgi:hypothetical protein